MMLNLPFKFTPNFRNLLRTSSLILIISTAVCLFYGIELVGETKSASQTSDTSFPIQKKWGTISTLPQGLKLEISQLQQKEKLLIPRMNNRIKSVYFTQDVDKKPLDLKPGVNEWEIRLPAKNKLTFPTSVVVEFKEPPYLPVKPRVIQENQKKQIILDAKDAIVHGEMLRFEPQPHKNTVGYWVKEKDWCEWKLKSNAPGVFDVYILQGCGKGQGGSKVELSVNESKLNFTVEDTGHFQNFKERHIGKLTISKTGVYSLQLKPQQKTKNAIMDVRQIRLIRQ